VKWALASLRDVRRLHDLLAPKSKAAARRAVRAIRLGGRLLGRSPEKGLPVEELSDEYREWVIDSGSGVYFAFYRFDGKEVVILAIRSSREDES